MRSDRANKNSNAYRDETQDELDFLDGTTAGTILASKAVIYGTNGEINSRRQVIRQTAATDWNDAAYALTTAQSGALVLFDKDEITTVTLPAITATDIGTTFTFLETLASDTLRKIVCAYDDDLFVGGITLGFDAVSTDSTGTIAFLPTGAADYAIAFDDDATNGAGGLGSMVTVTAILTGNTGAGGGDKLVWAVEGRMIAQAENSTGAAIFTTT